MISTKFIESFSLLEKEKLEPAALRLQDPFICFSIEGFPAWTVPPNFMNGDSEAQANYEEEFKRRRSLSLFDKSGKVDDVF